MMKPTRPWKLTLNSFQSHPVFEPHHLSFDVQFKGGNDAPINCFNELWFSNRMDFCRSHDPITYACAAVHEQTQCSANIHSAVSGRTSCSFTYIFVTRCCFTYVALSWFRGREKDKDKAMMDLKLNLSGVYYFINMAATYLSTSNCWFDL